MLKGWKCRSDYKLFGIKGNRIVNPLFLFEFLQVNCESDKQTLLILRIFSATKIKVDRKRACLRFGKFDSKVVLTFSDHLRKKCGKGNFLCDFSMVTPYVKKCSEPRRRLL